MKRTITMVLALVAALCICVVFSGCTTSDYTPEKKQQTVKDSALNSSGTLRVGVDASNAPYAVQSSGQIVGINVDVAAALADELGLKLELVDVGTNSAKAFTDENVDIVMGIESENSAYWLSDSYITSAAVLFSTDEKASAPTTTSSLKIAAQSSSMSAWQVSDKYGESVLTSSPDLQTAFTSLQNKSVNFVAADSVIGAYVAHSLGTTVYPIVSLQDPVKYGIAVKSSNTDLQAAIKQALSTINKNGIVSVITNKWLGDSVDVSSLKVATKLQTTSSSTAEKDTSEDNSSSSNENSSSTASATVSGSSSSSSSTNSSNTSSSNTSSSSGTN